MMIFLRNAVRLLPVFALLGLAACPQMTAVPGGSIGAPMGASGEDTSKESAKNSEDELTAPAAAAPLPVPSTGDGGGTPPSAPEMAARRLTGDGASGGVEPISNPVVARDSGGGVLGSPAIREAIDTPDDNLRIVYFPDAPRKWTNAEEFLSNVTEAQAAAAKERHLVAVICEPCLEDEITYNREENIPNGGLVSEPGYYLFFITHEGMYDLGAGAPDEWFPVGSVAHLRELVQDGRLKYLGDRTIYTRIHIDPSLFMEPRVPLPRGTTLPILRDNLLIR